MSKKVLEIIEGIAQAAADIGYDGAMTKDGEPVDFGMKRHQGHPIYDSRTMDGFKIGISGKTLVLSYHSDVKLKDIYGQDFEVETGRMIAKIISELKKRYKANTNKTLSLKKKGDINIRVETSSRVRCWATARCLYDIGNMGDVEDVKEPSRGDLEKNFNDFLSQGDWGKRPPNKNQKSKKA
jgi:hypothetical protein